jgi:hypothetical protein
MAASEGECGGSGGTGGGSASDPNRFHLLHAQLTYFTSHLSLADAKAAGITVFAVATAGVTADKLTLAGVPPLISRESLAIAALLLSFVAVLFTLLAIWPRTAAGRIHHDVFSWVGVAGNAALGKGKPHNERMLKTAEVDVLKGMADASESLAIAISRKYALIRGSFVALVPATLGHVFFWLGA